MQQVEAQHGVGGVAGAPAPATPVRFVQGLCQRFAGLGEVVQYDPEEVVTTPGACRSSPCIILLRRATGDFLSLVDAEAVGATNSGGFILTGTIVPNLYLKYKLEVSISG